MDAPPRKRRLWLFVPVGIIALVLLAPTIAGLGPVRETIFQSLLPPEAGRLSATGASFGWNGPLSIDGLSLTDPEGGVVFSAERIEVASGVLALALDGARSLEITVTRPALDVRVTPEGSNLDALLSELKKQAERARPPSDTPPSAPKQRLIRIIEGRARLTDEATSEQWLVGSLEATIKDPGRGVDAIEAQASGDLTAPDAAGPPGTAFTFRLGAAAEGGRLARVKADELPLSILGPLLRRRDPSAAVAGTVSIEGDASWRPPQGETTADPFRQLLAGRVVSSGRVTLTDALYRGVATGGEPLQLEAIDAPWRVVSQDERLIIEKLGMRSPIGEARLEGSVAAAEVDAWRDGAADPPEDLRLDASLDLRRLAQIAPGVLRLREGVRIESGALRLTAASSRGEAGPRVVGSIETESLTGVSGTRRVTWRDPLKVRFDATQGSPDRGPAGWSVDSLRCESSFLSADARGDIERFDGRLRLDLDRLATELAQFVDLGGARLAGRGDATFTVRQSPQRDRWRLDTEGTLSRLMIGDADRPFASEPNLRFTAQAEGATDAASPPSGKLSLNAGDDEFSIDFRPDDASATRRFRATLKGDLSNWLRRARLASPDMPDEDRLSITGAVELNAEGALGEQDGRVERFSTVLTNLAVDSLGAAPLRLREQRVELNGEAGWDARSGLIRSDSAELVSSVVALRARGVRFNPQSPAETRGEAVFRASAERLAALFSPAEGPPRWSASGEVNGSAEIRATPEGLLLKLASEGDRLRLFDRQSGAQPREVWREPKPRIGAEVLFEETGAATGLRLSNVRVESSMLNGTVEGRIKDLAALDGVQLSGGVEYDLERVTPLLWPRVGDGVRLIGKERAGFLVETDPSADPEAGPLGRLRGRFEAPWQGADLFGLPVGPGRIAGTLEKGLVRTEPLSVAVGQGRIDAQASAAIDPPPASLSLAPGNLVSNVDISQQVAERVLKFIAPVLADATRINGRFSLSLSEFAVPLKAPAPGEPRTGRAAGVLTIHAVDVLPGPAVAEWVALADQVTSVVRDGVEGALQPSNGALLSIREQPIEFRLADGRVYHRGLRFNVGEAVVLSEGSVGVDESLDLLLSIPILDTWIEQRPVLLSRMRGQALRIPVRGTFSQPQIDREAFRRLSSELVQSAAAGAIDTGINLLLERLRSR